MHVLIRVVAAVLVSTMALLPQGRPSIEPVPGAEAVAVGYAWGHVPAAQGVAGLLLHARAAAVQQQVPEAKLALHVDTEVGVLVAVLPAAAAQRVAALIAVVDDPSPLDDDAFVRARARLALQLDDEAHIVPGTVLGRRVHARLLPPVPMVEAAAVLALSRRAVFEHRAAQGPAMLAARGAIDAGLAAQLATLPCRAAPGLTGQAPASLAAGRAAEVHARIDQPFVAAALPLPPGVATPALLVAVEIARDRAARAFRLYGSELRAQAPLVGHAPLAGDQVVIFCRRGEACEELVPGQVAEAGAVDEAAATAAELERFFVALREQAPTPAEVSRACTRVLADTGLAPPTEAGCATAVLAGKLRASMLARWRGFEATALAAVDVAAATDAMQRLVRPEAAYWHTLLPPPLAKHGWRRRQ